jgi:hypothetical protein
MDDEDLRLNPANRMRERLGDKDAAACGRQAAVEARQAADAYVRGIVPEDTPTIRSSPPHPIGFLAAAAKLHFRQEVEQALHAVRGKPTKS